MMHISQSCRLVIKYFLASKKVHDNKNIDSNIVFRLLGVNIEYCYANHGHCAVQLQH
jgi:hypothetical protein